MLDLRRGQYLGDTVDTELTDVRLGSAVGRDQGLGRAVLVEQCRCPMGYAGISCQDCAPGYERGGPGAGGSPGSLGECRRPEVRCPAGYYRDPSVGTDCQVCPCPLQSQANQ